MAVHIVDTTYHRLQRCLVSLKPSSKPGYVFTRSSILFLPPNHVPKRYFFGLIPEDSALREIANIRLPEGDLGNIIELRDVQPENLEALNSLCEQICEIDQTLEIRIIKDI